MPTPKKGESRSDYISRCMGDEETKSSYPDIEQRYAVCSSKYDNRENMAAKKVSLDYDGVLSTDKGKELAKRLISEGASVIIISARDSTDGMEATAKEVGIRSNAIHATGSNKAKEELVKQLGVDVHYDNNPDVVNALPGIGKLFK